jgi:hypothetical protein
VCSVRYELGFYIPEDDIPHSDFRGNLKPYVYERFCMLEYCACSEQGYRFIELKPLRAWRTGG